jgi:hypothetical protein
MLASSIIESAPVRLGVFEQAVKDLESEWYDVKGFWRDRQSPGSREYAGKEVELFDLQFSGKIAEAERAKQQAELLKTYVQEYCKPLPAAEWKRLNDGYAKEEADRLEKQRLDQLEHMEETMRLLNAPLTNTVPK